MVAAPWPARKEATEAARMEMAAVWIAKVEAARKEATPWTTKAAEAEAMRKEAAVAWTVEAMVARTMSQEGDDWIRRGNCTWLPAHVWERPRE